jgi:hypothetical protein
MAKRPPVTIGLRLPPSTKGELRRLRDALDDQGETVKQEDLVGALLHRAVALVGNKTAMLRLGRDARAHKAKAKTEGF